MNDLLEIHRATGNTWLQRLPDGSVSWRLLSQGSVGYADSSTSSGASSFAITNAGSSSRC